MPGGLLVVAPLDPRKHGSLETQLERLAAALTASALPVTFLLARPPSPTLAALFEAAGAHVETAPFARPLAAAVRLRVLAQRLRPRIVHLHFVRAASPLVWAAWSTGAAVVVNDHMPLRGARTGLFRAAKRLGYRAVARLVHRRVAVSRHVAATVESAEPLPEARLRVIENGVDLSRFRPPAAAVRSRIRTELRAAGPVHVCVARMAHEKGVDVAIRAFARLGRGVPVVPTAEPSLWLVGDGPLRADYERLAWSLGVADRVQFLGERDDVADLLGAADQCWVPSRNEAIGLAAAEAMAVGLPVIASDVGGLPDVVDHGRTGVLIPVADVEALANAAASLALGLSRAAAYGAAGRSRAARLFSMDRFVERTLALYAELAPAFVSAHQRIAAAHRSRVDDAAHR